VVISLERGADLHTAQLMSLPLTVSCFSKVQITAMSAEQNCATHTINMHRKFREVWRMVSDIRAHRHTDKIHGV